jgi:F-type H+-transporting ATPase subunit b
MTTATPTPETEAATTTTTEGTEAHGGGHGAFPPMDTSNFPSQILWLAIAFGLLYLLMSKVALPRMAAVLEARRGRISGDLARAKALRDETQAVIADYEAKIAEARKKASGIAQGARDTVTAQLDGERAAIEQKLAKQVAEAEARITASKQKALADITTVAQTAAQDIVSSLTGGKVTAADAAKAVADAAKG